MLRLVANPGKPDERSTLLEEGVTTIGRTQENAVHVLHKSLSRQHARIEVEGGPAGLGAPPVQKVTVTDLDSKNGTFVNEVRVHRREVAAGDRIRCGDIVFDLIDDAAPPRKEVVAPSIIASGRDLVQGTVDDLRDKLEVLLKVGQLLSAPRPIDALLDEALDLVLRTMDVDRAAVLMVDAASGELVPRVRKAARGAVPERFYSEHIVRWVQAHGIAAVFADARADSRLAEAASILSQSICSSMCAPLRSKDGLLGVLYVDNLAAPDRFSSEDLEFLAAFAGQLSVAIDNSLLYKRLEDEAVLRSTLMRFFPPATMRKIAASRGGALEVIETEVTALFSDISEFTSMSSRMRPREVVDMLNAYFPRMADIVFRRGGTLEKYIGDALMAVWGAPFQDPDDADHAVEAAVDMQKELSVLDAGWVASGRVPLRIHVGINTGIVAAGNIGSEQYLQYATVGDATNVASRACSAAGPGKIVITENTRARLRRPWRLDALPPMIAKGKAEPLVLH